MKNMFALALSLILPLAAQATSIQRSSLTGILKIENKMTMVCMAVGCPRSTPYQQAYLILPDAKKVELSQMKTPIRLTGNTITQPGDLNIQNSNEIFFRGLFYKDGELLRVTGMLTGDINSPSMALIDTIQRPAQGEYVLKIEQKPLRIGMGQTSIVEQSIIISAEGRVFLFQQGGVQLLKVLNAQELSQLKVQVARAANGTMLDPNKDGITCLAMPSMQRLVSGQGGNVALLSSTFPCGHALFNTSPEGKLLIGYAQKLMTQYFK